MEKPKYARIRDELLERIRLGEYRVGEAVDSVAGLMARFGVSQVTAVRALAELESMGFVRREHGRGTFVTEPAAHRGRERAARTVAVIVPNMRNPFNIEVVGAIERRLRDAHLSVTLSCTDFESENERALVTQAANDPRVAGIVFLPFRGGHLKMGVPAQPPPIVVLDHCPAEWASSVVFITGDDYQGGAEAAEHLARLGHRRIGYLTTPYGSRPRFEGFCGALNHHGMDFDPAWIFSLNSFVIEDGGESVRLIDFVRNERLTALFAVNDMLAMAAMQILRAAGFRIPEDFSLVGYDDVMAARLLDVPLTTVRQYEDLIGRRAAECLLDAMISGNRPLAREIVVAPQLVVRASASAPPKDRP